MSSGACRALVAVLITLVAATVMALPVAAKNEALVQKADATYVVHPASGTIDVTLVFTFRTRGAPWDSQDWGPIVVEERPIKLSVTGGSEKVAGAEDLPGPWKEISVKTPRIPPNGETAKAVVSYTINAKTDQDEAQKALTPARVDESYMYFCVLGQDTDEGSLKVDIDGAKNWSLSQSGTKLEPTANGFRHENTRNPKDIFTCIEGARADKLATDRFVGPADRPVMLQAWAQQPNWLVAASLRAQPVLDEIHSFLGHDMPGQGTVAVRQAPERDIGGYASAHDTSDIVQLDERGGIVDPEHQLAHAWFGTDNFNELWLREAMAIWTASAMGGEACAPSQSNDLELDLSDWQVIRPTSGADYEAIIAAQEAAACGIVSAVAERMPEEQWREVIGSMLKGETKYIGSNGPGPGVGTVVDFREWLDAVDERGLVPAASDPAYADNLTDLDFAQNLLDEFRIPTSAPELVQRSEARALYHQFLADAAPLGAPEVVREAMDSWRFEDATSALDKASETLAALRKADELLPSTSLIPVIQPMFEAATSEAELDEVSQRTLDMLEGAEAVFGPLGDLQAALPVGWAMPAAVDQAIADQRFDDIMDAITPAIEAAQEVTAADAALPGAGLLEKYQVRYEQTATANKLSELADDVAKDRTDAERAGLVLGLLENEVGDWRIPSAITGAIAQGQIRTATTVIDDAREVVKSAKAADLALPVAELRAEIQPRFEAVETAADMAALRVEAEGRRVEAEALGNALSTLNTRVPDWKIPAVVNDPVEAGDFTAAAVTAAAAQQWIESAYQADRDLPQLRALERIREDFEAARSLSDLEVGAALAKEWAEAADYVARAIESANAPRDLLTDFGLWGVDVRPTLEAALAAAVAGEVQEAINKSGEVISVINSGSSSGQLRLAGLIFFGIAVLGVMGLWVILRRQSGPPWARSSTPHWVDKSDRKGLLGSGKPPVKGKKR
jgi:hypothetical protein